MFEVKIYNDETENFINSLAPKLKVKTFDNIALLQEFGNELKSLLWMPLAMVYLSLGQKALKAFQGYFLPIKRVKS